MILLSKEAKYLDKTLSKWDYYFSHTILNPIEKPHK